MLVAAALQGKPPPSDLIWPSPPPPPPTRIQSTEDKEEEEEEEEDYTATAARAQAEQDVRVAFAEEVDFLALPLDRCRFLAQRILASVNSSSSYNIPLAHLDRFLLRVQQSYPENPFHNFYHALAVLQTAHHVLVHTARGAALSDELKLACLLAALCHDIGHRGYTNQFEHNRASFWGGASPSSPEAFMEKMHSSLTVQLLWGGTSEDGSILAGSSRGRQHQQDDRMRRLICDAIMSTDMKDHQRFVGEDAKARMVVSASDGEKYSTEYSTAGSNNNDAGGGFFISTIVKVADLSSQTYSHDNAQQWGRRITLEFNNQVLCEDAWAWKQSVPFCDREQDFYSGQCFFIKTFAMPLWQTVAAVAPELQPQLARLERNLGEYARLAKECDPKADFTAAKRVVIVKKPEPAVAVQAAPAAEHRSVITLLKCFIGVALLVSATRG